MPDFAYIARDMSGDRVSGSITATSEKEALNLLSARSLFPLEVNVKKEGQRLAGRRVKGQVMATVYSQMAALLRSGVPMLRTIKVLQNQASNKSLAKVLSNVHDSVEQGETLADAMGRYPRVFNEMAVNMVRAGGEGGFLEEALERVAQFTEDQEDLKGRTVGALAYPVFLGVVGTGIVAVLIIFFVPMFGSLFDSLRERGELPALTDWLLWFSNSLQAYWYVFAIAVVALAVFMKARLQTEEGRRTLDLIKIKFPLLGPIFKNLAVARFCRVLGTMLRNGVPILKSLDISRNAAGNRILSEAIANASENISSGESLAKPLGASGHFPQTVVEMISVAEESNSLDTVLVDIADGLEKRTARRLDLAVRLLEPVMLLVLAGIVLVVVIALLLPVIKMSNTI